MPCRLEFLRPLALLLFGGTVSFRDQRAVSPRTAGASRVGRLLSQNPVFVEGDLSLQKDNDQELSLALIRNHVRLDTGLVHRPERSRRRPCASLAIYLHQVG